MLVQPFKSPRCIEASIYIPQNRLNFPTTKGFRMNISMKLVCQFMAIFFIFLPTSNHFHSLQVENCDSNSRLVVDEDDNGKVRVERVKHQDLQCLVSNETSLSDFQPLECVGLGRQTPSKYKKIV